MTQYFVFWKGARSGPFSLAQLKEMVRSGEVGPMHAVMDGNDPVSIDTIIAEVEDEQKSPTARPTATSVVSSKGKTFNLPTFDSEPISAPIRPAMPKPAPAPSQAPVSRPEPTVFSSSTSGLASPQKAPLASPQPAPTVPAPPPGRVTYPASLPSFQVAQNGNVLGVFTIADIRREIQAGSMSLSDHFWDSDAHAWRTLLHRGEFASLAGAANPAPRPPGHSFSHSPETDRAIHNRPALATISSRFVAAVLDIFLFLISLIPFLFTAEAFGGSNFNTDNLAMAAFWLLGVPVVLWFIQIYYLCNQGQSLGKMMMGIRISRVQDDANPGFASVIIVRSIVPSILTGIPVLGWFFWITDLLFIFRDDRRCIHDLLAGTHVVRAGPS